MPKALIKEICEHGELLKLIEASEGHLKELNESLPVSLGVIQLSPAELAMNVEQLRQKRHGRYRPFYIEWVGENRIPPIEILGHKIIDLSGPLAIAGYRDEEDVLVREVIGFRHDLLHYGGVHGDMHYMIIFVLPGIYYAKSADAA